jgi:hypothetical protein
MCYMNHATRYIAHVIVERDTLRARSAAVFGNRYLAEVVTAIADKAPSSDTLVTVRMLAHHTGLTDSLVKLVVTRLVNADLLRPLPQERPRGVSYHEVQRSGGLWDALVDLCERLERGLPDDASDR